MHVAHDRLAEQMGTNVTWGDLVVRSCTVFNSVNISIKLQGGCFPCFSFTYA